MTEITHPQLVAALVKPPLEIIQTLSMFTADLWHGATGVAGEAGELMEALVVPLKDLDRANVIEELGDLEFYEEQIRQRVHFMRDDSVTAEHMQISPDMLVFHGVGACISACMVLDTVKKAAVYNKPLDLDALRLNLRDLDLAMDGVRLSLGISREETLVANIAKLSKRYAAMTYSDDAAQKRADKVNEPAPRKFFGQPPAETANLGLASNKEICEELDARERMGHTDPEYRTVDAED